MNDNKEPAEEPRELPGTDDTAEKSAAPENATEALKEEIREEKKTIEFYEWADALVYSLLIIVLMFTLLFRVTRVEGQSMESTLFEDDRLVISNFLYTPKQGDIIVITKESFRSEPIVKRVIATGGQTVYIDYANSEVYVDGEKLEEDYIGVVMQNKGNTPNPIYVEEGFIFVMGDNRNRSTDSRFNDVGLIDERMVLGKVVFRYLPLDSIGSVY